MITGDTAYRCIVLAGPFVSYNHAATATITLESPATANAGFPVSQLADGRQGNVFAFAADGADRAILLDFGSAKAVDFLGLFAHNLTATITSIVVQWSDTGVGGPWTTMMSFDHWQPACYVYKGTGTVTKRYWRILFTGTNGSPIWIGELVIGVASVLARCPNYPISIVPDEAHIMQVMPSGDIAVNERTTQPARRLDLTFAGNRAHHADAKAKVYDAARGALYTMVIVPQARDGYTGAAKQVLELDQMDVMLLKLDNAWPRPQVHADRHTWRIGGIEQAYPQPMTI